MIPNSLLDRLLAKLAECGIRPQDGEMTKWQEGKINTFKGGFDGTRRATSYLLYRVIDGGKGIFGYFGDFHASFGDAVTFFLHEAEKDSRPTAEQVRRRNELLERARQESQQELRQKREEAARMALALYEHSHPLKADHPYLLRKRIDVPFGAVAIGQEQAKAILSYSPRRGDDRLEGELILIPLFDGSGKMVNVEMIDGNGRKCSIYGGQRGGAYWATKEISDGDLIGLAEGVATAQTITESAGIPLVSVGGCGNFDSVISALKAIFKKSSFIIFSDRGNGEKLARKAASKHGALITVPDGIQGTDFNDLMIELGAEALAKAIDPVIEEARKDPDGLDGHAESLFLPRSALVRPEIDFVLPGLKAGSVGLLVGQGSVGKTFLCMQIALSIACGEPLFWNEEERIKPGKVGMILGEDDLIVIQSRYHDIFSAYPQYRDDAYLAVLEKNLRVYGLPGIDMRIIEDVRGELIEGAFLGRLERFAEGKRIIFIDPLGKLLDGNENDNRIATRMMERLVSIGRKTGCAIVVLHHVSKSGAGDREEWTAARGAGAITANARWQANMRLFNADECNQYGIEEQERHDHVMLVTTKINYGRRPPSTAIKRGPNGVLFPFDGRPSPTSIEAQFPTPLPPKGFRIS